MRKLWTNSSFRLGTIALLGLLLRLPGLQRRPLWYDEVFSVLFSREGIAGILYGTLTATAGAAAEEHPPLYYGTLSAWMKTLGDDPFSVRLLSVFFGLGVIILAWKINEALFGSTAGFLGALFVAVNPFQIHYAQEARMYALLGLLMLGATLCLIDGIREPRWWKWILFGFLVAAGMYTHVMAAAYILPLALTPLLLKRWKLVPYLAAGAGIGLLLFLPWLVYVPSTVSKIEQSYWIARPGISALLQLLMSYTTDLPLPESWLPIGLFLSLLVTALAGFRTIVALRSKMENASRGAWLAYLWLSPIAITFLVSQWVPVFIPRVLIPSGVIFLIWIAWAIVGTQMPKVISGITGSIFLIGMILGWVAHYRYDGFPYAPFETANRSIRAELENNGIILHSNKLTMFPAYYYDRELPHRYMADRPNSGSDTLARATQEVIGLLAQYEIGDAVGASKQVFFVVFSRELEEYRELGYHPHPYLAWLGDRFQQRGVHTYGELTIYEFER